MIYDNIDKIPYHFLHDALHKVEGNHDIVRVKVFDARECKGSAYLVIKGKLDKQAVKGILKTITPKDHASKEIHPIKNLDYEYIRDDKGNPLTCILPNPNIDYTKL